MKPIEGKPVIIYPCQWAFKVIGWDENQIIEAIKETLGLTEYQISPSRTSRKGTYVSFNLCMTIQSEAARDRVYRELADHPHVKIVM